MGHVPTPGEEGDQINPSPNHKKKATSLLLKEKGRKFGITACGQHFVQPPTEEHLVFCNGDLFSLAGYKKRDYATVQT